MATSASLSLLLRRPRQTAWFIIRRLSSLPLSSTPNSDSDSSSNPSSESKPPTLSSRLSFVFDQLDSLSKPPDLSAQDSALRRIRSWWRRSDTHPDKEEKEELLKQNPKENMEVTSMAEVLKKKEVELVHPWPEWIELMERLAKQNYFDLSRVDEQRVSYDVPIDLSECKEEVSLDLSRDWLTMRNACMNFGRDRFDIIRYLCLILYFCFTASSDKFRQYLYAAWYPIRQGSIVNLLSNQKKNHLIVFFLINSLFLAGVEHLLKCTQNIKKVQMTNHSIIYKISTVSEFALFWKLNI